MNQGYGEKMNLMTAYKSSKVVLWLGIAFTLIQIVIAGECNFLGNYKMLISTCMGVPGIALLVTGLVMDNKLKPNSSIGKPEKILTIGLLIGSVLIISLSLIVSVIMRNLK